MIAQKNFLLKTSKKIRIKILEMSNLAKSSHIGSSLSIVEILLVLYKLSFNFSFSSEIEGIKILISLIIFSKNYSSIS